MATETNRAMIPFSNEHMAEFLKNLQAKGSPYWYGTCVYRCKESLLTSKKKQYPSHYTSSRMSKYRKDIAAKKISADCIGAVKGYAWAGGGIGVLEAYGNDKTFSNKYGSNGCPDKSANGMFEYAKKQGADWGGIATMPEIVGLAVRYDGHVGVYIGGGKVVEWRGFAYGSQITNLKDRKWTHWYKFPFIDYGEGGVSVPVDVPLGSRLLKLTDPITNGADVEMLQELLMQLGYELPEYGADGEYGEETVSAVKAFQTAEGLEVDGKYGSLTHAALMDAVADNDAGQPAPEEPEEPAVEPEAPAVEPEEPETPAEPEQPAAPAAITHVEIVSKGGNVNVRTGNGSQYTRITSVKPGARFVYVATAANGWHAIEVNGQVGWVSGDYSRLIADGNPPESPGDSPVKAIIDISRWQQTIDFDALKPEVEFVIARGMYNTAKDIYIDRYAAEMNRLGIPFGLYHFAIETTAAKAREEARAFYEATRGYNPLFYVLDAEQDGLTAATIRAWAEEMRALGAKKLGCYVAHNHYDEWGYDNLRSLFDFTWIPRYGSNDGTAEGSKKPIYPYDLWQYTSKGRIAGISTDVDLNLLSGTKSVEWFKER